MIFVSNCVLILGSQSSDAASVCFTVLDYPVGAVHPVPPVVSNHSISELAGMRGSGWPPALRDA